MDKLVVGEEVCTFTSKTLAHMCCILLASTEHQQVKYNDCMQVLIARADGSLEYEHVLFFSFKNSQKAVFTTITTDSGAAVSATPSHYLFASQSANCTDFSTCAELLQTRTIATGNIVWVANHGELRPSRVNATYSKVMQGIVNPHTTSGTIIVGGLVGATFAQPLPPMLWLHSLLMLPFRFCYVLLPAQVFVKISTFLVSVSVKLFNISSGHGMADLFVNTCLL